MHPIIIRKLSEIIEARRAVRLRWVNAILLVLAIPLSGNAQPYSGGRDEEGYYDERDPSERSQRTGALRHRRWRCHRVRKHHASA